jgi:hypothetical protein
MKKALLRINDHTSLFVKLISDNNKEQFEDKLKNTEKFKDKISELQKKYPDVDVNSLVENFDKLDLSSYETICLS